MGRRGYPPEFRRRVLDLIESGRRIAEVARDLDVSQQTIYTWRRQDRIDRGLEPGTTAADNDALTAANKRVRELETELEIARRSVELLKETTDPRGDSRRSG
jgi:transposase